MGSVNYDAFMRISSENSALLLIGNSPCLLYYIDTSLSKSLIALQLIVGAAVVSGTVLIDWVPTVLTFITPAYR